MTQIKESDWRVWEHIDIGLLLTVFIPGRGYQHFEAWSDCPTKPIEAPENHTGIVIYSQMQGINQYVGEFPDFTCDKYVTAYIFSYSTHDGED